MYESTYDGVRFIEGRPPKAQILKKIRVEVGGVFESAQLKNLDDVKRIMAHAVVSKGGNAIVDFKYGQRTVGFIASLFQRDDVNWYGDGWIAILG